MVSGTVVVVVVVVVVAMVVVVVAVLGSSTITSTEALSPYWQEMSSATPIHALLPALTLNRTAP